MRAARSESVRRSVCIDMKLTVQTFLTLDGVMQAPGDPIAAVINSRPKYVVSDSLTDDDVTWAGRAS